MAKTKSSFSSNNHKVNFGVRKGGKARKRVNKHDRKEKNYRGQGKRR